MTCAWDISQSWKPKSAIVILPHVSTTFEWSHESTRRSLTITSLRIYVDSREVCARARARTRWQLHYNNDTKYCSPNTNVQVQRSWVSKALRTKAPQIVPQRTRSGIFCGHSPVVMCTNSREEKKRNNDVKKRFLTRQVEWIILGETRVCLLVGVSFRTVVLPKSRDPPVSSRTLQLIRCSPSD